MRSFETNFTRSKLVESSHKIKILIKKVNGKVLLSSGNDDEFIYPRSAIKVFQAIPFVQSSAINKFKLSPKIIALSCSSHRGETYHIRELDKWIKKIKINSNKLLCGVHYPLNNDATKKILRLNKKIDQLYNNCAGKHLAMISSCLMHKYSIKNYVSFNHPHQIKIRNIFQKFSGVKIKNNNFGIDGCNAPQYSLKIKYLSQMLINLIKSYKDKYVFSSEVKILVDSVTKYPKYIGGSDSLDSRIMEILPDFFCKGGAEGVFLFIDLKKEISGVIKVVDGNERALPSVVYNIFKKFNIMNTSQLSKYKKYYNFKLHNHAKINIGSIYSKL